MTPEQFVYWLQGYVEIHKPEQDGGREDAHVWQEIKNHLDLVLTKKTTEVRLTIEPMEDRLRPYALGRRPPGPSLSHDKNGW